LGVSGNIFFPHLAFRIAQHFRGLLLYGRIEEIERADRFEFTPLLVENSGDRTGFGDSEAGAQPVDGFDQLLVFFPPVKERPERPSLLASKFVACRICAEPVIRLMCSDRRSRPCRFTGLSGSK